MEDKLRVKVDKKANHNPAPCPMAEAKKANRVMNTVKVGKAKAKAEKVKVKVKEREKEKARAKVKAKVKTVMLTKKVKKVPTKFPTNSSKR